MKMWRRKKPKMLLCLILFCVLLLAGCSPPAFENGTKSVKAEERDRAVSDIKDALTITPRFWNSVFYDAGIKEGDTPAMICEKLEQCKSLVLHGSKEENAGYSLKGLKYLPHLESLSIDFSQWDAACIEDFTPLAELTELNRLSIRNPKGEKSDLSVLGEMNTVTELFLFDCNLKDTLFLREMPQLEYLYLEMTPLEDMAVLENLTELKELSVVRNEGAIHMEAVGKLHKLEALRLQDCGIRDIQFLGGLTGLHSLDLSDNSISDITPLANLSRLKQLLLSQNEVCDLTPLASLKNLFCLFLDENRVCDISPLAELSHLKQAELFDNEIEDFSYLEGKEELLMASVFGNPCKSLKPVLFVPLLSVWRHSPSEEQLKTAAVQIKNKWPKLEEYECVDYMEGDLDGDGRMDVAFVVDGAFGKIEGEYGNNYPRRLVILLGQADGSFKEVEHEADVSDKDSGGTKGDPYRGIWMEKGCFLLQHSWGTSLYSYQDEALKLSRTTTVCDKGAIEGCDVTVREEESGEELTYSIETGGGLWDFYGRDYCKSPGSRR
ncbi:MAG: leucine-rich repeat domain-containing protein [Lachnospiraceae bacterium]|nr:leucine-rich repeat domain-containing protein [Lachnospiraceae bacterium]